MCQQARASEYRCPCHPAASSTLNQQNVHRIGGGRAAGVHSRAMSLHHVAIMILGMVWCVASQAAPTTRPAEGKLPHLQLDLAHHQLRVECEAVNPDEKLEFLCCSSGTKEYESVLRSRARPSHLHFALLMLGLEPGQPVKFNRAEN